MLEWWPQPPFRRSSSVRIGHSRGLKQALPDSLVRTPPATAPPTQPSGDFVHVATCGYKNSQSSTIWTRERERSWRGANTINPPPSGLKDE